MKKSVADLKLDKPVIIGEFAVKCSESKNATQCYNFAFNSGYSGLLSWGYDGNGDCRGPLRFTDTRFTDTTIH